MHGSVAAMAHSASLQILSKNYIAHFVSQFFVVMPVLLSSSSAYNK